MLDRLGIFLAFFLQKYIQALLPGGSEGVDSRNYMFITSCVLFPNITYSKGQDSGHELFGKTKWTN